MGRHRPAKRRLSRWLVPCAGALFLWLAEDDPAGVTGLGLLLGGGALLALFWPLLVLLAMEAPGALVPSRWRAWYHDRHRDEQGNMERPHVSARLRRLVYAADRHACCYCRSSADLNLDHYRPWKQGGRTSYLNMLTLCAFHNRVKSDYWVARDGRVHYHAFTGHNVPALAADIFALERRRRWSPARIIRAAIAL